jgi:Fe-S-cluster containining protein
MATINYKEGIRFECQGSGKCCVSRESYGFVYLSDNDLKRFSNYFKLSIKKFKEEYCQITDGFVHLIEKTELNGNCIFLKDKKCSVYTCRPSQCRTWPFWNENMNAKIWNKNISINCPGIGKGEIIKYKIIKKLLKEDLMNEKSILKSRVNPLK